MVDDKLFIRIMMAELGIPFPETLAFTYCTDLPYDVDRSDLNFVSLDTKNGVENLIRDEIQKFLELEFMQQHDKVDFSYAFYGLVRYFVGLRGKNGYIVIRRYPFSAILRRVTRQSSL